jgi:hypothetical protein
MIEFVLHTGISALEREQQSATTWLAKIEEINSRGFCDTLSLCSAELYDGKYMLTSNRHHSIGPMLEFASIGKRLGEKWENAGWLCTFIESATEIYSLRSDLSDVNYGEYSIYTGVHVLAENCICPLSRFESVIEVFLNSQTRDDREDWLEFSDVFMTYEMYNEYLRSRPDDNP